MKPKTSFGFRLATGELRHVQASEGESVMTAAIDNEVPGIGGDCGGSLLRAICHVYVEEDVAARLPPGNELEEDMLELAIAPTRPTSRLGV